jgi:hypothetical protein
MKYILLTTALFIFLLTACDNSATTNAEDKSTQDSVSTEVDTVASTVSTPTREALSKAWILDARFKIDYNTGAAGSPTKPAEFKGFCEAGGTATWAKVPGLRSKYFTISKDEQYGSGIYTFLSKEDLDNYMNSDLFKGFGSFPHITELDIKTYRVLAGSEVTMDMGTWPSGQDKPSREDIESAVVFYPRFAINYETGIEGSPTNHQEFEGALVEPMNFAKMWHNSNVPGLRSKYFTIDETNTHGTGIYTFVSQKYLDDYLESKLLATFKSFPHIVDLEADVYQVIGGTELTMAVNPW